VSIAPIHPDLRSSLQSLTGALQVTAVNIPGLTINPSITGIAGTDTKVAQALMISLAQLSGPHRGYSASYLNSTSLDSSQSIKVFLLTLMEALNFEHEKSSINTSFPFGQDQVQTTYTHFHHPEAQTLLEDELLDLIDDIYAMHKSKIKSKNPINDLELTGKKMLEDLGMPTDDSSIVALLNHIEKLIIGSSVSGNFVNSKA
jgi:hypothetical protein